MFRRGFPIRELQSKDFLLSPYTTSHGAEDVFTYYERIGELEDKLGGKGFFRCHKSYLVNLKYVDGYNRQEAVLENGEKIVIAKRRYDKFVQEVFKVMRENGGIL